MMRWGLVSYWAKDAKIGLRTINAKAETITTAPALATDFGSRRTVTSRPPAFRVDQFDNGGLYQFIRCRFKQTISDRFTPRRVVHLIPDGIKQFISGEFIRRWSKQFIDERAVVDHGLAQLFGSGLALAVTRNNLVSRAKALDDAGMAYRDIRRSLLEIGLRISAICHGSSDQPFCTADCVK